MHLDAQVTGVGKLASAGQIDFSCILEIQTEFHFTWPHPETSTGADA